MSHILTEIQQPYIVLFVIAFSAFMASLDSVIVNISLPVIVKSFHVEFGLVSGSSQRSFSV